MGATLAERMATLETEVARLQRRIEGSNGEKPRGWKSIVGIFTDDPDFEEAVRFGSEYREFLWPESVFGGSGADARSTDRQAS